MGCDERVSADHSFRFAKMIMNAIGSGKLFTASYTIVSLKGMINANRLCHTKSNDEIDPMIIKCREVRVNAGEPKLKRYDGDGSSDRSLWVKHYPELQEGVTPYNPPKVDGLVRATIAENKFSVFTTQAQANSWAENVAPFIAQSNHDVIYVGLDSENNRGETSEITRTLQLAFPSDIHDVVVVIHLSKMGALIAASFPKQLRKLLQNRKVIPVSYDIKRLEKLGVAVVQSLELMDLAKQHVGGHAQGYGMKALCGR
jgi:hypothetical protein